MAFQDWVKRYKGVLEDPYGYGRGVTGEDVEALGDVSLGALAGTGQALAGGIAAFNEGVLGNGQAMDAWRGVMEKPWYTGSSEGGNVARGTARGAFDAVSGYVPPYLNPDQKTLGSQFMDPVVAGAKWSQENLPPRLNSALAGGGLLAASIPFLPGKAGGILDEVAEAAADATRATERTGAFDPQRYYRGAETPETGPRTGTTIAGHYVNDPEIASLYAGDQPGANVMPVNLRKTDIFDSHNPEHLKRAGYPEDAKLDFAEMERGGAEKVKAAGFNGYVDYAGVDPSETSGAIAMFNPDDVRSIYQGALEEPKQLPAPVTGIADPADYVSHAALPKPVVPAPTGVLARNPESIPELFGTKTAREDEIRRQLANLAPIENEPKTKGGKRAAIPADYYRKLEEEQGRSAVLDAAQRGEHIKPYVTQQEGFVGFPRHITNPEGILANRQGLDDHLRRSAEAVAEAERAAGTPERSGTWYDRAKEFNWLINEPYQLPRHLETTATYSAGASPESELAFSLKHENSRALGAPGRAYRGGPMRNLDKAVEEYRPAKLAAKIGEYRRKNDPGVVGDSLFGVNDFRWAQSHGYTDPSGKPWKAGVSATMHPVMDLENALMVERANANQVGGRTDWTGEKVQAAPWVGDKAQDFYGRGKKKRYAGPGGMAQALRDANNTAADYAPKHTFASTYESTPGLNTGHRADIFNAPYDVRSQYHREAPWTVEPPGKEGYPIDSLYSALGLRQLPTVETPGIYENSAGQVEFNDASMARTLADFKTVETAARNKKDKAKQRREGKLSAGVLADVTHKAYDTVENLRGVIDAQEGYGGNLPITASGRKNQNDVLLNMGGRQATQEEMKALHGALDGTGFSPIPTARGVVLKNFNEGKKVRGKHKQQAANTKAQAKALKGILAKADDLRAIVPDANVGRSAWEGVYGGALGPEVFTNKYTTQVLEKMAELPEHASRSLAESEDVRSAIRRKIERDQGHPLTRKDVQATRDFFANKDWADVVARIRKGATVAAALGSAGYGANSLAGDDKKK